ncbi:class I SAM-dependent methyltransferase [Paenibacillus elgii]|uniref:class I SAM-dependent methyltransferase n=1 Tax=Paenibacillus elgii TaxID=189691 RepID=UPI000248DBDF|nr:methyltransferase domain-containing protein [Paenibacillus elgii]
MIEHALMDKWLFFYKYMRSPKQIGSVTPSSRFLASKLVSPIAWDEVKAVAELGAGTGAVTRFIRQANRGRAVTLLFEQDPLLRSKLGQHYPEAICCPDAAHMRQELERNGIPQLDAVISGLPFYNFTEQLRERLLEEIHSVLKPGGQFIAFQYSLQMKRALQQKFVLEKIAFVPWNVPPAFVYVCRKK